MDAGKTGTLGGVIAEFRGRVPPSQVVLFGFWAVLTGAAAGRSARSWELGLAIAAVILVPPLVLIWRAARKRSVQVCLRGLRYRDRKRDEVWRWLEVEEWLVVAEEREIQDRPKSVLELLVEKALTALVKAILPRRAKYRVQYELRRPGHKLVLTWRIRNYHRLGEMVGNLIKVKRLPGLLASARAGEKLEFGRFVLGPAGVTDTRSKELKLLTWAQLRSVSASRYRVSVHQVGAKRPWAIATSREVPNAVLLEALASALVAAPPALVPAQS
jgi:hypothetical protein